MKLEPDFGPENALFPPLPVIKSDSIKLRVFTHRSFFARATHVFEDLPDDLSPDNERFEHLGDTVLGMTITHLLMDMYPGLRVGPSTKIRAMMVGNPTLAEISVRYKLPDRLRLHPAQAITLRASTNIQADVFEAFVGGLYIDSGLELVKAWLEPLFRPYARAAYKAARQQHGLPPMPSSFQSSLPSAESIQSSSSSATFDEDSLPTAMTPPTVGHLALFNQHIQKANRQVEWIYSNGADDNANGYADMGLPAEVMIKGTKTTPVWYVKVLVDGMYHGRGRGNTKRAARNEAAKEGLRMMEIIV